MLQKDSKLVRPLARVGGTPGDEEEGESNCPPGLSRRNLPGAAPQFLSGRPGPQAGAPSSTAPGAIEPANLGWGEDLHCAPGATPGSGLSSQGKDSSFMDAVLMKLHDEDLSPPPSKLDGGWFTAGQPDYTGGAFMAAQNTADRTLAGALAGKKSRSPSAFQELQDSRYSNTGNMFESVGDLGFRNIQECIDGLPLAEINGPTLPEPVPSGSHILPAFDKFQSPSAFFHSQLDGTGRGEPNARAFGHGQLGNAEKFPTPAGGTSANNGSLMDSILRVLHDSHEDDSSSTSMYNMLEGGDGSIQWPGSFQNPAWQQQRASGIEASRQAPHIPSWFPSRFN
mmetsp:Transcript_20417/g.56583  ORF Transcript_20417/g.56583 Transcript_20417/m.56583 type:complete len:339 (-) Transcript_20417:191-1207(-)